MARSYRRFSDASDSSDSDASFSYPPPAPAQAPIRSRVAPDINPLNGGIVDASQQGDTCPGSCAPRRDREFTRRTLSRAAAGAAAGIKRVRSASRSSNTIRPWGW